MVTRLRVQYYVHSNFWAAWFYSLIHRGSHLASADFPFRHTLSFDEIYVFPLVSWRLRFHEMFSQAESGLNVGILSQMLIKF